MDSLHKVNGRREISLCRSRRPRGLQRRRRLLRGSLPPQLHHGDVILLPEVLRGLRNLRWGVSTESLGAVETKQFSILPTRLHHTVAHQCELRAFCHLNG